MGIDKLLRLPFKIIKYSDTGRKIKYFFSINIRVILYNGCAIFDC